MSNPCSKWRSDLRGPYIRLRSGHKAYFLDPRVSDLDLEDIAYHAAGLNRYTGGSRISIAQHMVTGYHMAKRFYPTATLLPARILIHDVAEAIIGDVSSPLKSLLPDYRRIEADWDKLVEERFNLTFVGDPLVKELDDRLWLTERLTVYEGIDCEEDYSGPLEPFPLNKHDLADYFTPWSPTDAMHEWFDLASQLETH